MGVLTRVSSSDVEDLVSWLHILRDDVLEARVALIPVELLLVLLITVFPVFLLTVLSHFFLFFKLQSINDQANKVELPRLNYKLS